jgi:hypothetical protein
MHAFSLHWLDAALTRRRADDGKPVFWQLDPVHTAARFPHSLRESLPCNGRSIGACWLFHGRFTARVPETSHRITQRDFS